MRLVSGIELEKISAGNNRAIAKSVITISGLIISGAIYLIASDLELSYWHKAGIGFVGFGMIGSILLL